MRVHVRVPAVVVASEQQQAALGVACAGALEGNGVEGPCGEAL